MQVSKGLYEKSVLLTKSWYAYVLEYIIGLSFVPIINITWLLCKEDAFTYEYNEL